MAKSSFYMALDSTVVSVPVSISNSKLGLGTAHPLFRANPSTTTFSYTTFSYNVAPGGGKLLINTAAPERTAPITLVENWQSELK